MDYSNINYNPEPINDGEIRRTGWANPNLDWKMIRNWYKNFDDWQNKLPKTDYTKYSSSIWYTHEWVPGVPVIPNLSRPPIHKNGSRFDSFENIPRQRFVSFSDESFLLNGNGNIVSPVPKYNQKVWYKRLIYTISTVIITITTTIINTTIGRNEVSGGQNTRIYQNGAQFHDFSDQEDECVVTTTAANRSVFNKVTGIVGNISYAVVAPFYALYRMMANLEAYMLNGFHNLIGLRSNRHRNYALLLLLIVPYLILFGWGYRWNHQTVDDEIPLHVEAKDEIPPGYGWSSLVTTPLTVANYGWSSLISPPLTAAYGGLISIFHKKNSEMIDRTDETKLELQKNSEMIDITDKTKPELQKNSEIFDRTDVIKLELQKTSEMIERTRIFETKMEQRYDEFNTKLDELRLEIEKLNTGHHQQQQMFLNLQATFNAIVKYQKPVDKRLWEQQKVNERFLKQGEELGAIINQLRTNYDNMLVQMAENHQTTVTEDITNYKEFIHQIVKTYVNIYDADKINIPDYALLSSGGSVLSTRCTKSLSIDIAILFFWFDVPWSQTSNPFNVLRPSIYPGECWCFVGSEGHLVIKLSANITITSVTLEHAHRSLLPPGAFESAPNKFTVFGLEAENDINGTFLGTFLYKDNEKSLQQFETLPTTRSYNIVELYIQSNHGAEHTCVYRFRVHGNPDPND